jgi:cytochrome oxidase Cu insertion factor (SCO1/SenC/PrrC family)
MHFEKAMNKRQTLQRLAACALLAGSAGFLAACSDSKPSFSSVDVTGVDYAKGFELTDHNGQVRHLTDFAGKVVLMFFGYTQCPDVCPTTMTEMIDIKRALGKDGERLQVLFVTVDPERDTPELLKAYMEFRSHVFGALQHPRKAGGTDQGLQNLLQEGGWQHPYQLHHGPLRRQLHLRPQGQAAPVHPLWQP